MEVLSSQRKRTRLPEMRVIGKRRLRRPMRSPRKPPLRLCECLI
jgi:hypothetical protein